jgi:hypothetical protein
MCGLVPANNQWLGGDKTQGYSTKENAQAWNTPLKRDGILRRPETAASPG